MIMAEELNGNEKEDNSLAVRVNRVSHRYGMVTALSDVSLSIGRGLTVGLVGSDGVGKSTLLSLIAGTRIIQQGSISVFGCDIADGAARDRLALRVAFMPQGLGRNLYPTLSVRENLAFHADLFGLSGKDKTERILRLMDATSLTPFADRDAGHLSGGMKQKLSLCCALIHSPDLLILDEPTTGVDPLSRRRFWTLVDDLRRESPGMTVIVSTAYIDEAEGFQHTIIMNGGTVLADEGTRELMDRMGAATLEEAYMRLLPADKRGKEGGFNIPPYRRDANEACAITASGLTKRFGDFTAVDGVSFEIGRGEIFGFLGSNGCGKSTTMKMLTGLLEPTAGTARILGREFAAGDSDIKMKVGYMSQAFSLYEELTVTENLYLHAKLYHIPLKRRVETIRKVLDRFSLYNLRHEKPASLSLGIRQRLQLAAACLHEPEILILDEPTSGVDPSARDMFWDYLIKLSREDRVTIFVSTHFMNEAERCDRISLMHRGRVLAVGTPEELKRSSGDESLENSFIRRLEEQEEEENKSREQASAGEDLSVTDLRDNPQDKGGTAGYISSTGSSGKKRTGLFYALSMIRAFAVREAREILRDRIRMFFVIFGALIFEISASYGISFDMTAMPFGVIDHDGSPESRALVREFGGSAYLYEKQVDASMAPVNIFQKEHVKLLIDIPEGYGNSLLKGEKPEVGFMIDGAFPVVSNNVRGYVNGIMAKYNARLSDIRGAEKADAGYPFEIRFMYNEIFRSVYVMVPGLIMLAMVMFPAMMTALGVVREKDLGTISNLYTSPASVYHFLIGKQIPYIILSLISFLLMTGCAVFMLNVPIRGSFWALFFGAFLMIAASSSFGLLVSCFVRTQVAAIFGSAILSILPAINFSGFLYPLSTLEGAAYHMGRLFPCSWFQIICLGSFTKGLGAESFLRIYVIIGSMALTYLLLACMLLRKQEK